MKTKGIVLNDYNIVDFKGNGYFKEQCLSSIIGRSYHGNCVIVLTEEFRDGEIDKHGLADRVEDVYYYQDYCIDNPSNNIDNMDFTGKWCANLREYEAIFTYSSDAELFEAKCI